MRIRRTIQIGALAGILSFSLIAQDTGVETKPAGPKAPTAMEPDDPYQRQRFGNNMGQVNPQNAPESNPGYGREQPNYAAGNTPQTNSTLQQDQSGTMSGFNPGWFGLLGLAGLFGLKRSPGRLERAEGQDVREHHPQMSRS